MLYIKDNFPRELYEQTFVALSDYMYHRGVDISKQEGLKGLLADQGFSAEEITDILAAPSTPKYKQALLENTQKALDQGAFGAPWFQVRNSKGQVEPFFGSDR